MGRPSVRLAVQGGSGGQLRVAAEEAARAAPALPAHAVHVLLHRHRLCLHG